MTFLYVPFFFQALLMGYDEILHRKRGLGAWERLGHPVDTMTVFAPMSFIAINEYTYDRLLIFIMLAVFSCLVITKDEFVHSVECSPIENWVHSMLFVLHPMIFVTSALIWKYHPEDDFLGFQAVAIGVFMIYQVMKWSLSWKEHLK